MATLIAEAIEIITDDGRGIPVAYANTGIGLAADGHFYLITDRFGLNGTKTITGDTAQTSWYEGILTRDFGAFAISRSCDFVEAGAMEQVSGLNFAIKNTGAFFSTLASNGVYLSRRRVKYYRVTSSDGVTFNFEQRWEGVIEDQPFNELSYSIKCIDASKDIFKSTPVESVNPINFEEPPEDSQDKFIPIAIGRVSKSTLVSVSKSGTKSDLCLIDSVYYQTCAAYAKISTSIALFTSGVNFEENDSRLVGKYLLVVAGGTSQAIRIISNAATLSVTGSPYSTTVTLAEDLADWPGSSGLYTDINNTSALIWYFQVFEISQKLVASQKPIFAFASNANGTPSISAYESSKKRYEDVSEVLGLYSSDNIEFTGHPGITAASNSAEENGSLISYTSIYPKAAKVFDDDSADWTTNDLPAIGSDAPILYDGIGTNYYTFTKTVGSVNAVLKFDIELPKDDDLKLFDDLYLLLDFSHFYSTIASDIRIVATVSGIDIYGRLADTTVSGEELFGNGGSDASLGTAVDNRFALPRSYYNSSGDDSFFYTKKTNLNISSLISSSKMTGAYNRVRLAIGIASFISNSTYTFRLHQVGVIARRSVDVNSEPIYSSLIGETFGTTWDGRKTPTNPIENPADAFEHLLRNYDTSAPVWQPGKAYVVGSMIRGTADTGHIFVCTTAGTSHASTEPTWTDTAGATYSDGTVAWKEFRTIPVDTNTFDAASFQRSDWKIGRTLVENKPSEEWYKQILAQSFLISTLDARGKVKVKAWRENTTPLAAFSSATNIIEGTVEDIDPTPMRRVYNDLRIRYDWNPGANKFNKQITVTKADQPAFPAPNATVGDITSLGTFTITNSGSVQFLVGCDSPHGLTTGDYASLSGNTDGFDFEPRVVSVLDADYFYVNGHVTTAGTTSSGSLVKNATSTLLWKTFVTGIRNYARAARLWGQCRASYLISKSIQKLPEELGDCYWFIDPYATSPDGGYIWSDDGGQTCNLDVGDDHAAVFFAQNVADWTGWQKKQAAFEVADTAAFSALEIGDPVTFADAKLTGGVALPGWIQKKVQIPRTKDQPERFRFGVILNPEQLVDPDVIDENGADAGDIIDENSASAGNIIDENGA